MILTTPTPFILSIFFPFAKPFQTHTIVGQDGKIALTTGNDILFGTGVTTHVILGIMAFVVSWLKNSTLGYTLWAKIMFSICSAGFGYLYFIYLAILKVFQSTYPSDINLETLFKK